MFIDTHVHLDFNQFKNDRDLVVSRAVEAGVGKMINVGTNLKASRTSIELTNKYPQVYATCGIHPHDSHEATDEGEDELVRLSKEKKVVAIGEIGLDYFKARKAKEIQINAFVRQLKIARRLNLPVIIHNREADRDVLRVLKEVSDTRGVFHFFSSSLEFAREVLKLGFFLSFTGVVTFAKKEQMRASDIERESVIKEVSLDKLIVESDSPFAAPEPYRAKRCEPAYVIEVAKKIAEIKGISLEEIAETTTRNAGRLFNVI